MRLALPTALLAALACAPGAAQASIAKDPWPPLSGPGHLFVHYGEEHWNDDDGLTLLPKIVEETRRYRPRLVTLSGDKANDGVTEELSRWEQIMARYETAGIPYYAGVGNHDRDSFSSGGLPPPGPLDDYAEVFRDRPYPFGDASPKADPRLSPRARPAGDPAGAASHYYVDYGDVRWVFIDNSCFVIDECDLFQRPSAQTRADEGQFAFMERVGREAGAQGKLVFVVMHMPTRDPGDQSYREVTALNHVMGKGATTDDNEKFERVARAAGVDGVFVGHIKGQFVYRGDGGVPYYVDGGAGGELYTDGPVGTDHGYWHGLRLLRVANGKVTTDTVPIFVKDGIRLEGPTLVNPGRRAQFEAFGRQPVFKDPAKVPNLELRDPDPVRPASGAGIGGFVRGGGWIFVPVLLLVLGGMAMNGTLPPPRRRALALGCAAAGTAVVSVAGASLAQRSAPTTTPRENLPTPARIFTSSNPNVIAPLAAKGDDPRRDARTQTDGGLFEGRCPGRAKVSITSGFETTAKNVLVPSNRGRIVRRVRVVRAKGLRRGVRRTVARIRLSQRARVLVRVRRRGRTVRVLRGACLAPGSKRLRVTWNARARRRGKLRAVKPGRYRIQVFVRSDRRTVARGATVRVRR